MFKTHFLIIASFFIFTASLFAQDEKADKAAQDLEPQNKTQWPKLEPVFSDDFSTDTRSDYKIIGKADWEIGELKLNEQSSIECKINNGLWTKIEIDSTRSAPKTKQDDREKRVWFLLTQSKYCCVRIREQINGGDLKLSIAIVASSGADGRRSEQVLKAIEDVAAVPGRISIEFRHGLLDVSISGRSIIGAYFESDEIAVCTAIRIASPNGTSRISRLTVQNIEREVISGSQENAEKLTALDNSSNKFSLLFKQGKFKEAAKIGEQNLKQQQSLTGVWNRNFAAVLSNMGGVYYRLGDYVNAKRLFDRSLNIRRKLCGPLHPDYANSLNGLAILALTQGKYPEAESYYTQCTAIYKRAYGESHLDYAEAIHGLAYVHMMKGAFVKAEPLFLNALEIEKKNLGETSPTYAGSLSSLSDLYLLMGEIQKAEQACNQSLEIFKNSLGEQHYRYALQLGALAQVCQSKGEYLRAEQLAVRSRQLLASNLGEYHPLHARALQVEGVLYQLMGEVSKAVKAQEKALKIQSKSPGIQSRDYANTLNNLAGLYGALKEYAKAEQMYSQALDTTQLLVGEEHFDTAKLLQNIGRYYLRVGNFDKAKSVLEKSKIIWESAVGKKGDAYVSILINLGQVSLNQGNYSDSETYFSQAEHICRNSMGEKSLLYVKTLRKLGHLHQLVGEQNISNRFFSSACELELEQSKGILESMSEAGALAWVRNNNKSLDQFLGSLRQQDNANARSAYDFVWHFKSSVSRSRISRTIPGKSTPEVQNVFGRLRDARLRLANLVSAKPQSGQVDSLREAFNEASEAKELLEKELATMNPACARALSIRDAKVEDLLKILPTNTAVVDLSLLDDWRPIVKTITLKQDDGTEETRVVKDLEPTLVYDAFILRGDQDADAETLAEWVQLGDAEPINAAVAKWRGQLTGEQSKKNEGSNSGPNLAGENSDPAERLRKLVWSKLEPHLKGYDTVIILPDGDLNKVPWAALPGREPGTYLIEDYAIATANYGQQLFGLLSDEAPQGDQLLVAGGIKYDQKPINKKATDNQFAGRTLDLSKEDRSWDYLTGAENEAKEVLKLWKDRGAPINLSGIEANEDAISQQLEKARYAHLATHGFFDKAASIYRVDLRKQSLFETSLAGNQRGATVAARNPLLMTGIVLAGANLETEKDDLGLPRGKDGILTAEEIVGLNLRNLDLVTLSACETGLGDVAAGEGVFGLQRALHQAGARSVIASLWKVDDNATQALMVEFYKNLWEKKLSKVESLRQAQLAMIKRYDLKERKLRGIDKVKNREVDSKYKGTPPFLWAAFQLSGDFR